MNRRCRIGISLVLMTHLFGCEQPFSPKRIEEGTYVLQCFVEVTQLVTVQRPVVLLARVYDVEGLDPSTNTIDPAIKGAYVELTSQGRTYELQETTRVRMDSLRYGTEEPYYTATVASPGAGGSIRIMATLPDGHVLDAETHVPRQRGFELSYQSIVRVFGSPDLEISWEYPRESEEGHLFFVRLSIPYTKRVDGGEEFGVVEVAQYYEGSQPVYPLPSTRTNCSFPFACIDSAMTAIAGGDTNKIAYGLHEAVLEVLEFDLPLSKYYASTRGSLDRFSIRANQPTFSNINGGVGILGTSYSNYWRISIDRWYIESFGYRYR